MGKSKERLNSDSEQNIDLEKLSSLINPSLNLEIKKVPLIEPVELPSELSLEDNRIFFSDFEHTPPPPKRVDDKLNIDEDDSNSMVVSG